MLAKRVNTEARKQRDKLRAKKTVAINGREKNWVVAHALLHGDGVYGDVERFEVCVFARTGESM